MDDSIDELSKAISAGADVNCVDESGRTPLQLAAYQGNDNQARLLLESGATPELALRDAIFGRRAEVLQTLIDFGVDLTVKDENGQNVLHRTCSLVFPELVEVLLNAGMDVNCADDSGLVPLHLCTTKRALQMGDICISSDPWRDTCELLLSKGANPKVKGPDGETPLHCAAVSGHATQVAVLIDHGENPNLKNLAGFTPLESVLKEMAKRDILMPNKHEVDIELDDKTKQFHQVLSLLGWSSE